MLTIGSFIFPKISIQILISASMSASELYGSKELLALTPVAPTQQNIIRAAMTVPEYSTLVVVTGRFIDNCVKSALSFGGTTVELTRIKRPWTRSVCYQNISPADLVVRIHGIARTPSSVQGQTHGLELRGQPPLHHLSLSPVCYAAG